MSVWRGAGRKWEKLQYKIDSLQVLLDLWINSRAFNKLKERGLVLIVKEYDKSIKKYGKVQVIQKWHNAQHNKAEDVQSSPYVTFTNPKSWGSNNQAGFFSPSLAVRYWVSAQMTLVSHWARYRRGKSIDDPSQPSWCSSTHGATAIGPSDHRCTRDRQLPQKKKQKKKEKHSYSEINKREKRKNIMHLEKEETENKYLPFTGYISTLFMRLKSHEINK